MASSQPPYLAPPAPRRLNGDLNPLHIDPVVAKHIGFDSPILHGLCTLGVSVRRVVDEFGGGDARAVQSIKVGRRGRGAVCCGRSWLRPPC